MGAHVSRRIRVAIALAAVAVAMGSAGATTLVRMSVGDLTTQNESVVLGRVVDLHSRWNADNSLIVTDVRVAVEDTLKGPAAQDVTFTVLGGTVGDRTLMIVGGAELEYGSSYVLFLSRTDLPGAPNTLTVRDLCQAAFDIVESPAGIRAVSQASRHPMLKDYRGIAAAPGGVQGLEYNELVRQVRQGRTLAPVQ